MRPPIEKRKEWLKGQGSWPVRTVDELLDYIDELEDALVRFGSGDPIHTGEWEALDKMVAQIPKEGK